MKIHKDGKVEICKRLAVRDVKCDVEFTKNII